MINLKNFEIYTPDVIPDAFKGHNVIFFRSEEGVDFYDTVGKFKKDTVKILYRDGMVVGFGTDGSALYPAGASLIEVSAKKVPEDLALDGKYIFDSEKVTFTLSSEYISNNLEQVREKAMTVASSEIEALQDKIDVGEATKEDLEKMKLWKRYRINVREAATIDELPKAPSA